MQPEKDRKSWSNKEEKQGATEEYQSENDKQQNELSNSSKYTDYYKLEKHPKEHYTQPNSKTHDLENSQALLQPKNYLKPEHKQKIAGQPKR